jgi:DNA-binding transcriptional MerR regulator
MHRKELKIGDLAHLTGISEQDVRALVRTYDSLFTYRTIGPVKLFSEGAVQIIQDLIDLSGRGLTPEEITEVILGYEKSETPEEPTEEVDRTGIQLPPEMVIDLPVLQDTLAWQGRQITRLAEDLTREQEARREETARLCQTIENLQDQLERQQEQLDLVAEWVDYFDLQMDEVTRPVIERIRRALGKENKPAE